MIDNLHTPHNSTTNTRTDELVLQTDKTTVNLRFGEDHVAFKSLRNVSTEAALDRAHLHSPPPPLPHTRTDPVDTPFRENSASELSLR
jgi:hypothetical protein